MLHSSHEVMTNAIDRIHAHGRFSGAPGLHRIRALCAALGDPQKQLKFIHLAGTNGKGSTAAMLAAVFENAGYRVGLYTSPYLVTFHERIRVNGEMISDAALTRLTARVEEAECTLSLPLGEYIGEFEFVTALGFLYFAELGCDMVILETGLGGLFDATNIIDPPEVAVLTPISFDHTAVLGQTIREIAQNKAGIIKPGSAVVCAADQPAEALAVICAACPAVQIPAPATEIRCGLDGGHFTWKGQRYDVAMLGWHQVQNAQTALQTIEAVKARGWQLPDDCIRHAMQNARMSGRMEILRESPRVIVDGGHNEAGVKAVASTVRELGLSGRLHLVIGMVNDKDVKAFAFTLGLLTDSIFITQPESDRALAPAVLAALMPDSCAVRGVYAHATAAFAAAMQQAQPEDTVIICGSLYLVGEAKKFWHT